MTSAKDQEQDKDFIALLTRFDHLAARVKRLDGFEECIDIEAQESVDAQYPDSADIRKRLAHLEKTVMQIVTALSIKATERSIDYNRPTGIVYACGHTNADSNKTQDSSTCAWMCRICGRTIVSDTATLQSAMQDVNSDIAMVDGVPQWRHPPKPSGTTKTEPKPISGIPPTFTIVLPYARIYGTTHNDHRFLVLELHHLDELNTRVSSVLQHEHVSSLHTYLGAWLGLQPK